jgi:hypothetical protein
MSSEYNNYLDISIIKLPSFNRKYKIMNSFYNREITDTSINPYDFNDDNYSENPNNDDNNHNILNP